jgi:hypothetical protein
MRWLVPILIAAVAALTANALGQPQAPPLFAAFQAFCVDTGAKPDAVEVAVEVAGGIRHTGPSYTASPSPMTETSWKLNMSGHDMIVSTGTMHPPARPGRLSYTTSCIIDSFANEDASVAAIGAWAGVPASNDSLSSGPAIYKYDFLEQDSRRSELPTDKTAYNTALAKGRVWSLVVIRSGNGASVQLTHYVATAPGYPSPARGGNSDG